MTIIIIALVLLIVFITAEIAYNRGREDAYSEQLNGKKKGDE